MSEAPPLPNPAVPSHPPAGLLRCQAIPAEHGKYTWSARENHASLLPRVSLRVLRAQAQARAATLGRPYNHALELTRRQQAKSLELRAATRLSRLWYAQGRHDEARQLLADIYGWFSEGFAMPDLQEARLLLDQLSPTPRSSQFASHLSPGTVKILTP